jgi:hypothetical protein
MKTRFTKDVAFLKPFLKGLGRLVPLRKISIIRGYRVAKRLNELSYASIVRKSKNDYRINLQTQILIDNGKKHCYTTLERILINLAHELAHLKGWGNPDYHRPYHFKLQSKILLHFSKKLSKLKIKDHNIRIDRFRSKNAKR